MTKPAPHAALAGLIPLLAAAQSPDDGATSAPMVLCAPPAQREAPVVAYQRGRQLVLLAPRVQAPLPAWLRTGNAMLVFDGHPGVVRLGERLVLTVAGRQLDCTATYED